MILGRTNVQLSIWNLLSTVPHVIKWCHDKETTRHNVCDFMWMEKKKCGEVLLLKGGERKGGGIPGWQRTLKKLYKDE